MYIKKIKTLNLWNYLTNTRETQRLDTDICLELFPFLTNIFRANQLNLTVLYILK